MIVLKKCLVRCPCGFSWFSRDPEAVIRALDVHRETCKVANLRAAFLPPGMELATHVSVWPTDSARHCRENEPRQTPAPSRADRDGKCSWNCRGSYSWNCFCPCQGERHGENHVWDPDERKRDLDAIYGQIERAKPRGDWRGRKST